AAMTSGGTNPPRPPAAPTNPVTEPTTDGSLVWETSAKTAPEPRPRPAALTLKSIVPSGIRAGWKASISAAAATAMYEHSRVLTVPKRPESVGARGGLSAATSTKPHIRKEAPAASRPYQFCSIVGRSTEQAT